jgi:hypothetical protein
MTRRPRVLFTAVTRPLAILAACAACGLTGCALWPWASKDRTNIITPAMRAASIREFAPRGRDASPEEQQRICTQLAQQIQTEPDPIVRKVIQETIGEFHSPLADAVILAGLNDEDRDVRLACCRLLGERGRAESVEGLSRLVKADADVDVRMAAVDALGAIKSPAAVNALAVALKDRDPAMQMAGVMAMKSVSGKDLGNDVQAWRQYAAQAIGENSDSPVSVATQPTDAPK